MSPVADDAVTHLVILVHGIRTRARWQISLQPTVPTSPFHIVPTNYGYFDIIRFLLPIPYFRNAAIKRVWTQIRGARVRFKNAQHVSFLAHSFGTFIIAEVLRREFDFKAHRVVFCGSVVAYDFPFEQLTGRFTPPLLNDVGSKDPFPALAESATWGYGSAGTFGFRSPYVTDRWHNGFRHSDFLKPKFFKKYWQPFFEDGTVVSGDPEPEPPPLWIWFISVFKIRYFTIALIALTIAFFSLREGTTTYSIPAKDGVGYLSDSIRSMLSRLDENCIRIAPLECLRQRRCVRLQQVDDDVDKLVICKPFSWSGRDPYQALQALAEANPGCLKVTTTSDDRVSLNIGDARMEEFKGADGSEYLLCNCPTSARQILERRHGAKSP
jgi:hypothetical protein